MTVRIGNENGQHALDPVRRACPARPLIRPPLARPGGPRLSLFCHAMAVDLLTWVCGKLADNAPHAANGLADFVADRVLRRFVVLTELRCANMVVAGGRLAGDRENYRAVIILQATERYHRTQ